MTIDAERYKRYNKDFHVEESKDITLPTDFNNLVNLRHFIASPLYHYNIAGIGRLKHLQELKSFGVRNEKGYELEQLVELGELRGSLEIFGLKNVKRRREVEKIKLPGNISCLTLSWFNKRCLVKALYNIISLHQNDTKSEGILEPNDTKSEDILEPNETLEILQPNSNLKELSIWCYAGCELPSWLANHSLSSLEIIYLYRCEAWEVLPNFGQLECLKELYLMSLPKVKKFDLQFHGCLPQGGFPLLKLIKVYDMAKLKKWECGVFPSLESLIIRHCPELSTFTISVDGEGQKRFPKLCNLEIMCCPKLVSSTPNTQSILETDITEEMYKDPIVHYTISEDIIYLSIHLMKITKTLDHVFLVKNFRNIKSISVKYCQLPGSLLCDSTCIFDCSQDLSTKRCPELLASPLKEVNDEETLLSQKILQELTFDHCKFSRDGIFSLLNHISGLCELAIEECSELLESSQVNQRTILHPLKTLQKLTISKCGFGGDILTSLLKCLPSLRQLSIISCANIGSVSLPTGINEPNSSYSQKASLGGVEVNESHKQCSDSLMYLQELYISYCPNLVFIDKGGLSGLIALKKVAIDHSQKLLSSINCFPEYLEELSVGDVPCKMIWSLTDVKYVHTLNVEFSSITLLKLECFVALRKLKLYCCWELAVVRGSQSLDCLEVIIDICPYLTSTCYAPWGNAIKQKFLMPARKLHIDNIEFLSSHANNLSKSLRSLTVTTVRSTSSRYWIEWTKWTEEQEKALQLLTALKKLTLYECEYLCSLPGTYYSHPSLEKLTIDKCSQIKSLPENLPNSLRKLLLGRECSEELRSQCSKLKDFECTNDPSHQDHLVFVKKSSSVSNEKGKKLATTG